MGTSALVFFWKSQISAPIGPVVSGRKLNLRSDLKDDGGWSSCNRSKCQFWLEYFLAGIENCGSGFKAQNSADDVLRRKIKIWKKWTNALLSILVEVFFAMFCLGHWLPCRNKLLQSVLLPFGKSKGGPFWMANQRNHRQSCSSSLSHGPDYTRALSLLC